MGTTRLPAGVNPLQLLGQQLLDGKLTPVRASFGFLLTARNAGAPSPKL